ncbi:MAG TPA: tetratricopeptide repeat protein, partial [Candidatus Eisenbacteria bacterium]|nr:tetratricopeptide repeat protein [Candidatus Eisenbacteria bacterium]
NPNPPALEAQVRARLVRAYVEQGNTTAALSELNAIDAIVGTHPEYKSIKPEVDYSRAKIRSVTDRTPQAAVALLDRVAAQYPTSAFGARALLEAGVLLERHKLREDALERYRAVGRLYSGDPRVGPVALFRQAMLEEQTGNWDGAKRTLETIPVKYPASQAAAEAPITVALRYLARKDRPAALAALSRAIVTYQELIAQDTTSAFTTAFRWNMLRCQLPLGKWEDALRTIDEMSAKDKGHPYTAQALLEGARVAKGNRLPDRAAAYLKRYLDDYPSSPLATQVRSEREKLLQEAGGTGPAKK